MGAEEYLALKFQQLNLPGFACSISYRDKITDYYFGKSDTELDEAVSGRSVFNIASVAKLITVACVFKLIEANKFGLHTTLGELLPDIPRAWQSVRIEHLLSHSSGIKNYTDIAEYWSECHLDVPKSRIIEYVQDTDLQFEPGSRWRYSNTGFYLLGFIIENISGKNYFEYAAELISSYKSGLMIIPTDDRKLIEGRVSGYTLKDGNRVKPPYYSNSGTYSAGGFSAILHDFLDFETGLFNGNVLNNESLQAIIQPFKKADGTALRSPDPAFDFSMTHGLFRFEGLKPYLAHRGEMFGFTAEYRRMINEDFSVILAANTDCEFDSAEILNEVYRLITSGD